MKKIIFIIIISCLIFFSTDFFFGKNILSFLYESNIIQSPEKIMLEIEERRNNEKSYRIKNNFYHHTLKSNIKAKSIWGNYTYDTCTDEYGFRVSCKNKVDKKNKKKIIVIGDSFTEGLGLNYNETFVGMFDKYSKHQIINMGVTSYSPIIYWNKIKHFLNKGFSADHVIVFIDISDIDDEANNYKKCLNSDFVCDRPLKNQKFKKNDANRSSEVSFPLFKQMQVATKRLKRNIKPKIYIYRKNFERSYWTYSNSNEDIERGIKNALKYMEKLNDYLSSKNISLSVAVYPHPAQILYDNENSKQVQIWKNYCELRCKYFINLFPLFLSNKDNNKKMDLINKYFIKNDIHFNQYGNKKIFEYLIQLDFGAPGRI